MQGENKDQKQTMGISIIVPVYNVARWLARCLDSLLSQGLDQNEYEIILVDDGSTDDSPAILARYAAEHPQIRVFKQENGGPGMARNKGLELARGEWIAFVDADDQLAGRALASLLPFCSDDTEGIRFYCQLLTPGMSPKEETLPDRMEATYRGTGREFIRLFGLEYFCWSWLYKKSFLDKHGIRFSICLGEDLYFLYHFLAADPAVVTVPSRIYYYFVREGSITTDDSKDYCRIASRDIVSVFSGIRKDAESFRQRDIRLFDSILDSLAHKMPMLFARIFKADLTVREFRELTAKMKESGLIPVRCRKAGGKLRLFLSAINLLSAFPALYAPGKYLFRRILMPYVYPRLNRNKDR